MNDEEEDLEVIAAVENQGYFERNMNEDIDMMEDGGSEQNEEDPSEEIDP